MPTVKEIFDLIEEIFIFEKLATKPNWGRNEIKEKWLEAKAEAALRIVEWSK